MRGNPLSPHGLLFPITARVLLYAPSHRQDSTYHGLCYTSRGALAGTRNSSMGPPPWRIDSTTHRTMSERSYHGATSRSPMSGMQWSWPPIQTIGPPFDFWLCTLHCDAVLLPPPPPPQKKKKKKKKKKKVSSATGGMVHIKDRLLLTGKSSPFSGGSGFPLCAP